MTSVTSKIFFSNRRMLSFLLLAPARTPIRFNELQRLLGGITTKTLTGQLRELEEQGIVVRKVFPEVPPKVEYSLSEIGTTLNPILSQLCDWGKTYHTYMETYPFVSNTYNFS